MRRTFALFAVLAIIFSIFNNIFFDKTLSAREQPCLQSVIAIDEPAALRDNEIIVPDKGQFKKVEEAELEWALHRFNILPDDKPEGYGGIVSDKDYSSEIRDDLLPIFNDFAKNSNFNYFLSVYDFATNTHINFNESTSFYPACMIKTLYLYTYLEQVESGISDLNKTHVLSQADKYASGTKVTGTGSLQYQRDGTEYSYDNLLSHMITISDNVAANIIMDSVGIDNINQTAKKCGMNNTRVNRKFYEVTSPLPSNSTTAKDLNRLLILLENRCIDDSLAQLGIGLMEKTANKNRTGRFISKPVKVANKTGTISSLGGDTALIYYPDREPVAMSIVLGKKKSGGFNTEQMQLEIGRLAKKTVEYFGQHKNPDLFIDGEKVQEDIRLRYIDNVPHINITNIDRFSNLDKNRAAVINGSKYYSLPDIKEQLNYGFDTADGSFVHLYSLY